MELKKRSEFPENELWDLTALYQDQEDFLRAIEKTLHGVEHPVDHRLEKNFRHDGWPGGFHSFPLARGKDDGAAVILHENGPFPETMHFDYPILCQDCACFSSLSLFRNCNCEKIDR